VEVILEPVNGTAKDNLERARLEIERVLAFRGSVTSAKTEGKRIIAEFEVSPKWDLPMPEKVKSLKEWIPAMVRTVFKITNVE
jgi:hypothetical protein